MFDVLRIGSSLTRTRLLTPNRPSQRPRRERRAAERNRYAARDDVVRRELSARSGPLRVFPNAVVRVRATIYSGGAYTVPHS